MNRIITMVRRNTSKQQPVEMTPREHPNSSSSSQAARPGPDRASPAIPTVPNDQPSEKKIALTEEDCYDELGFSFSTKKKWLILVVIFLVQTSMNFNTSLYSNAIEGISAEFDVSLQAARAGAAIFLFTYAFGCELWAPWSEEFGRKPILQLSLGLVNIWNLPVALAPNFGSIIVARALGGLSSAGGSVTLGMIADIFESDNQQLAVAFIVFSSVGGSVLGPVVGGFVQQFLPWRWCIWIQLIFGVAVQILHLFCVPETRTTILMDKIAKKRRKEGTSPNIYGPNELISLRDRLSVKEILITWARPFKMFITEPIVSTLSLLSGFSDAIIFMQIQSFGHVYTQWGFNTYEIGLAFLPILIGYFIGWAIFIPGIQRNRAVRARNPTDEHAQYESRLWLLLYTAPLLPIGLIIFAWTSSGPPIHWIGSMFGSAIIGIANYSIYMATIDYMICAYGPYSASATGGNGWARDFLAGVLTVPATPFITNIGPPGRHLQDANTILFCISTLLVLFVYIIYWQGPQLRKRSPFAQKLISARTTVVPDLPTPFSTGALTPATPPRSGPHSRRTSYEASVFAAARSRQNSRQNSAVNSPQQSVVDLHAVLFAQEEISERLREGPGSRSNSRVRRLTMLREARTREEGESG